MSDYLEHSRRWQEHRQPRRVDYHRPGFVRPPDPEPEPQHECGYEFDRWCDGCRVALRDAGGDPDAA